MITNIPSDFGGRWAADRRAALPVFRLPVTNHCPDRAGALPDCEQSLLALRCTISMDC
jgi:hypothetical protein